MMNLSVGGPPSDESVRGSPARARTHPRTQSQDPSQDPAPGLLQISPRTQPRTLTREENRQFPIAKMRLAVEAPRQRIDSQQDLDLDISDL